MNYAHTITVPLPYEEAVAKVRQELANQGFGVLTEIDVHTTFETKLGSESAHTLDDDSTVVEALDPQVIVSLTHNDGLSPIADDAGTRIAAALDTLTQAPAD